MAGLQDFRAKHPEYNDMSDPDLAAALHRKFYSDMPVEEFNAKMGLDQLAQAGMSPDAAGYAEDIAKSGGIGLVKGAIAMPGAFGDAAAMNERLASNAAGYLGAPEWLQNVAGKAGRYLMGPLGNLPTSDFIQKTVEGQTGKFYQPKTVPGQYAETIGEFAPSSLLGPGSVGRKAAMTVVPAVASETAGLMSDNNPYAKTGAAVVGSVLAAGRGGAATREMLKDAPAAETVKAQTDAAYNRLRNAGVQFKDNPYKGLVMRIQNKLREHGWRPRDGDPISGDIKELKGRIGKPNDWSEVENLRRFVGNLPKDASNTDIARAKIIKDEIDAFIAEANNIESTKGIAPEAVSTMSKQARELARRNILANKINEMSRKSEGYLSGDESGMRNQFGSFIRREGKTLKPAELAAFKKVVRREGLLNLLTTEGSRFKQAVAPGAGAGLGFLFGGPVGAAVGGLLSPAVGLGARKIMEKVTQKQVEQALKTVLAGPQATNRALLADRELRRQIVNRGLLGSAIGYQSSSNN